MNDPVKIGSLYSGRLQPGTALQRVKQAEKAGAVERPFKETLQDSMVRISNHAAKRLEQRGIELQPEVLGRISQAIDSAAEKGAKDSLILMKDMALIVNVNNRTVVTAMDGNSMKNNVFTQIDSAVIIN